MIKEKALNRFHEKTILAIHDLILNNHPPEITIPLIEMIIIAHNAQIRLIKKRKKVKSLKCVYGITN